MTEPMTDTVENIYASRQADLIDRERMLTLRLIAETAPAGSYCPFGEASVAVVTGAGTATANGIIWSDLESDPELLVEAIAAFPHIAAPWGVQVRGRVPHDIRAIAECNGLLGEMVLPTMALSLTDWTPDDRPGATVDGIHPSQSAALARAISAGKGATLAEAQPYATCDLLERPEVSAAGVWTGGGRLAGAGLSITITPSVVGLYAISTVLPGRRHGLGHSIMQHLLIEAREKGATTAYIQASPMARPLCESIGFETVEEVSYLK
ncbi:GNAT family N-acetyltransferase [Microbacterium sp. P04]|uniref:GNAT family N-acetyltransferase n=1 Tax=Microbacterium sp. P04 TaxID=3366947 RepID=UPI00374727E6